jgi:hypothetical protein
MIFITHENEKYRFRRRLQNFSTPGLKNFWIEVEKILSRGRKIFWSRSKKFWVKVLKNSVFIE